MVGVAGKPIATGEKESKVTFSRIEPLRREGKDPAPIDNAMDTGWNGNR